MYVHSFPSASCYLVGVAVIRVTYSRFISAHLLGHEGKGSLLSELKRLGWVSSLSAGDSPIARGMNVFDIHVDLSVGKSHY